MAKPIPIEQTDPALGNQVLDMLAQGASQGEIAASTGLSTTGVRNIKRRGLPVLNERSELTWPEFGSLFKQKIRAGLEALTAEKLRKASVRDISILMGIFTDKALVIDGRPNVISHMDHSDRRVLPELLSILKSEFDRRGTQAVGPGATVDVEHEVLQ